MPLHDVGYRAWTGATVSPWLRWWVIATVGIRIALRSTWLGRTLILSAVPAIGFGVIFFVYEQSITQPELRQAIANMVTVAGGTQPMIQAAITDPVAARHEIWSALLLAFFRYPQTVLLLVVVGLVAPRLISYDLRNKGYLLYFSRPIQPWEYILGKSVIVWFFIAVITTMPAILLYIIGLSLSSDVTVVAATWDLPLRVVASSFLLMVPTTALALACSALTIESRNAVFAWFAVWLVGWVTYGVLTSGAVIEAEQRRHRGFGVPQAYSFVSRWELLSPYHLLGRVQQWIFGLFPEDHSVLPYLSILLVTTVLCLLFIYRQLRARMVA
ncbi:MAG: ABC transporter permease subunit [Planctomycetales bacterium]|nr:ABC transporter permease subunit [Planctomycetales bacterium]